MFIENNFRNEQYKTGNGIGIEGTMVLCEALKVNSTLKELILWSITYIK